LRWKSRIAYRHGEIYLDLKNREELIIGSRGSKLALWQAEWVKSRLEDLDPSIKVRIEIIKTTGDVIKDQPLSIIGGKGVFTKEIEEALLQGVIDIAVHSLKDLPTILPDGLMIAAITEREDPRDALVLQAEDKSDNASIKTLPEGATVGTSSPRRLAQLKALRPDLNIKELRGNVDTRLRKLDDGQYSAIILASAGLCRLGLHNRISASISIDEILPAVGQGALGIEVRRDDQRTIELLSKLNHTNTHLACTAERAFLRALGGGCQLPIAAHAIVEENRLTLYGLIADPTSNRIVRSNISGILSDTVRLGEALANQLNSSLL
jgi:hydroxymethylbilane synthase